MPHHTAHNQPVSRGWWGSTIPTQASRVYTRTGLSPASYAAILTRYAVPHNATASLT
ncbi:hypothetical protein HMPREF1137_1723 [Actinomyces sp. ICM39]|nr:hypothetical protein HMPREF1137_1723 [Actinomyces sp. ICM39]